MKKGICLIYFLGVVVVFGYSWKYDCVLDSSSVFVVRKSDQIFCSTGNALAWPIILPLKASIWVWSK